jgi:hypothetical protein
MERFNLKKLKEVEGKEHYCTEVSNGSTTFDNLNGEMDINSTWEIVRISKFQPKRAKIMTRRRISKGLVKDVQNY